MLFAAFGSLFSGYGLAVIVSTVGQPTFYSSLNLAVSGSHTTAIIGAANGVFFAGGFFGCLISAWAVEGLGRLNGLRLAAAIGVIGAAIQTGAVNQGMVSQNRAMQLFVSNGDPVLGRACHHRGVGRPGLHGDADVFLRGVTTAFERPDGGRTRVVRECRICAGRLGRVGGFGAVRRPVLIVVAASHASTPPGPVSDGGFPMPCS